MQFSNKTLLVTGGTQGIGLETALVAAEKGAKVIVCGRSVDTGKLALEEAAQRNVDIDFVPCDIKEDSDIRDLVNYVGNKYGQLDLAFNNAGITSQHSKLADSSIENWRSAVDINITGTYLSMKYEIASMLSSGGGAIVNTSSAAGVLAIGGQAAYVATKAAIIGLTQSAAIDYANPEKGPQIRINAVAPGPILGGMNSEEKLAANPERTQRKLSVTAMHRFGTAREVANTVLWLLSEDSAYTTGTVVSVDGGYVAGKF